MFNKALITVLELSLSASFTVVCVLMLRLLLRKAPRIFSYALWGIVLLRLLCPFSLKSPVGLVPQYHIAHYTVGDTVSTTDENGNMVQSEDVQGGYIGIQPAGVMAPADSVNYVSERLVSAGGYIWAAGILALLGFGAVSLLRLRRRVACSMKLQGAGDAGMAVLEQVDPRLRNRIYLADDIQTPFVMGLFQPRIYLPSSLAKQEQEYIILHEQHHIRRLDHVVKALSFAALCLHWFNPFVWLAFILAGKDMEMSCDEAVMRRMNRDIRADYSASLLHLATGRSLIAGMPLAFGEGNPKSRIKNVMGYRKPSFWVLTLAALICVAAAVCFLTDQVGAEENPNAVLAGGGRLEKYDFDHDGMADRVELETGTVETPWVLRVTDRSGTLLWSEEAYAQHTGWNSIFVCRADGQDYLLRYHPTMYQGFATYHYEVFYLTDGQEVLVAEDTVDFDINGGFMHESFDPAAMAAFAEGLNGWLKQGKILLNTDDSVIYMDPQQPRETFAGLWKMLEPETAYDEKLSLEENLKKLAEEMEF